MKRTPLRRGTKMLKRTPFKAKTTKLLKNARAVPKRPKSSTSRSMAWYKKELDRVFSLFIRQIHPKICYTCNKPAERLQNGHYISRQYLATRWSVHNCRPQCWGCNGYGKGQPLIFEEKLKAEYGHDFVEQMKASRHQIIKLDIPWYKEQIAFYTEKLSTP